jgi:predicted membrane protein
MIELAMVTVFLVMMLVCIVCVYLIGFFLVEAYKYLDRELFCPLVEFFTKKG